MMGRQTVDQGQLFYLFNLEKRIPERHLLRRLNPIVGRILGEFRQKLLEAVVQRWDLFTERLSRSIVSVTSTQSRVM
jgi:hypothetical protein